MSLLSGGNAGLGKFPAKFTFDVNAAPSCANDFVAYNTSIARAAAVAATQIGTFLGAPTNGKTVTITDGANSVIFYANTGALATASGSVTVGTSAAGNTNEPNAGDIITMTGAGGTEVYQFETNVGSCNVADRCVQRSGTGAGDPTDATNLSNAIQGTCFNAGGCPGGNTPDLNVSVTSVSANIVNIQGLHAGAWGNLTTFTSSSGTREAHSGMANGGGDNTGRNFLVGTTTDDATNLAAAIMRNNATIRVTATSLANVVTVTATFPGADGDAIALAKTIPNVDFKWTANALAGGAGQANILAFNQLYSTQGSAGGLCNQDGPSVYWSYFTGTGQVLTSIVLSEDGSKVAFVENAASGATLRILNWDAGEGTDVDGPASPTTTLSAGQSWAANCPAGNSCLSSIAFNGSFQDTGSSPFYDYNTDVLYVGDDSSRVHKFTGVFKGTPTEVTTGWPIQVNGTANLSSVVFDGVSGNIFVGDDTGRLSYIREVGSTTGTCPGVTVPPCLSATNLQVGTGGAIIDSPVVDGSTGLVLAFNGADTSSNHGTVLQATTALASPVSFKIGGSGAGSAATNTLYAGAFDNTYFSSNKPTIAGHMYVCGKDPANTNEPAIYQLSFTAATGVLSGVGTPLTGLVSAINNACSPVTEVYNPNGGGTGVAKDWIFFSVGNNANTVNPIPTGSTCRANAGGCLMSIDVTGSPTWPPTVVTNARAMPANAAGSTSGIVVDNVADSVSAPQASSIYLSYGVNSTASVPCNGVAGVGCAEKLTQSALQ